MQELQFAQLDAKALTFAGLSRRRERRVAMWSSLMILVVVSASLIASTVLVELPPVANSVILFLMAVVLAVYIFTGQFLVKDIAVWVGEGTPIAVLYRSDKKILDGARAELLQLAEQIDFRRYYHYRKINPAIGCRRHLLVMAHQKKGDLLLWSEKSRNLKALADLVYQFYLAERIIQADRDSVK